MGPVILSSEELARMRRQAEERRAVVLTNNVFVGAGAKIVGGVSIGDDAKVGANAVVVDDTTLTCTTPSPGLLGPNSNAHGPNEFLHIDTGKRVTSCVAQVLADHYEHKTGVKAAA